jgi:hypothetical protein
MCEFEMDLYFADKAFADAILTGKNQIFLSASLDASHVIRKRIIKLAKSLRLNLDGGSLTLPNGAEFYFFCVGVLTVAGFNGNAYAINCFDENNFSHVRGLMDTWTMQKQYCAVFYSAD